MWAISAIKQKEKKINFQEFKIFAIKTHLETERYRFFLDLDGERDDLDLEREWGDLDLLLFFS